MTTTPKGYTGPTNASAMSGPEQINAAELFVENLIGESVATAANLPTSGNWVNRSILVTATNDTYVCTALPSTWTPQWPKMFGVSAGLVGGTPPAGVKILEQAGTMSVNSNASGDCGFTYPVPFPNGVLAARVDRRDFSNYGLVLPIFNTTQTLSVLNFRLYLTTGVVAASLTSVPFTYHVTGW